MGGQLLALMLLMIPKAGGLASSRWSSLLRRPQARYRSATKAVKSNETEADMLYCAGGSDGEARYYLGDNETLFAKYIAAMGWSGEIASGRLDAERAELLWRRGELVVGDSEVWRRLLKSKSELPTGATLETQLEGGAQRAANMWRWMTADQSKDVNAAREYLAREGLLNTSPSPAAIQHILDHFKENYPYYRDECDGCGAPGSSFLGEVACVSEEEVVHRRARRAELRLCEKCGKLVRFTRTNDVARVLADHRGRCGEYSTAMLAFALALGLEARWILDSTDHVWLELLLDGNWLHVDPCEAALDQPGLYASWGKNGSLVVAFERTSASDVTPVYYSDARAVHAIRDDANLTQDKINLVLNQYSSTMKAELFANSSSST